MSLVSSPDRISKRTDLTPVRFAPPIRQWGLWREWIRSNTDAFFIGLLAWGSFAFIGHTDQRFQAVMGLVGYGAFWVAFKRFRNLYRYWKWRSPLGADASVEEIGTAAQHVFVQVVQDDVITGEDCGVLWLEDGHLKFAGARTSFVITQEDVSTWNWRVTASPNPWLGHPFGLWLTSPIEGKKVFLAIAPSNPPSNSPWSRDIQIDFRSFARTAKPGRGQFPPLSPGPGAIRPGSFALLSVWRLIVLLLNLTALSYLIGRLFADNLYFLASVVFIDTTWLSSWRTLRNTIRYWRKQDQSPPLPSQ